MKNTLIIICLFISVCTKAQNDTTESALRVINYDSVTAIAINKLYRILQSNPDSAKVIISEWERLLGPNEYTRKLAILLTLFEGNPADDQIRDFIDKHYLYHHMERVHHYYDDSFYWRNRFYFSYVPIRHPLDSAVINLAHFILSRDSQITPGKKQQEVLPFDSVRSLTVDEHFICTIFSGDLQKIIEEKRMLTRNKSYIKAYVVDEKHEEQIAVFEVCSGIFTPLGSKKIFPQGPMYGFGVFFDIEKGYELELAVKFRPTRHDKDFLYFANDSTNVVNADFNSWVQFSLGYKMYTTRWFTFMPKASLGFNVVPTGIEDHKEYKNPNNKKDYDVIVPHLTLSLTSMVPVLKSKALGFDLSYHFIWYQWESNLKTKFDNSAVSLTGFIRF